MKKLLALMLAAALALSLVACGGDTPEETGLTAEECIGTWEWSSVEQSGPRNWDVETMELYAGGTGKGFNSRMSNGQYYPLAWEITDDFLKVSLTADPLSMAFEVDGESMTSTDGNSVYLKQ